MSDDVSDSDTPATHDIGIVRLKDKEVKELLWYWPRHVRLIGFDVSVVEGPLLDDLRVGTISSVVGLTADGSVSIGVPLRHLHGDGHVVLSEIVPAGVTVLLRVRGGATPTVFSVKPIVITTPAAPSVGSPVLCTCDSVIVPARKLIRVTARSIIPLDGNRLRCRVLDVSGADTTVRASVSMASSQRFGVATLDVRLRNPGDTDAHVSPMIVAHVEST